MARQGKIARLPAGIRRELNQRLEDGQLGPQILPWLNGLPEVRAVCEAHFGGDEVTAQNLSDWRTGGYADHLREKKSESRTRELADYSLRLAQASGGHMSSGSVAIAAGHFLKVFERLTRDPDEEDDDEEDGEPGEGRATADLKGLVESLRHLHNMETDQAKIRLKAEQTKLHQDQHALNREKFEQQTVDKFLDWAKSEDARKILDSGKPRHIQASLLHKLMFGEEDGRD